MRTYVRGLLPVYLSVSFAWPFLNLRLLHEQLLGARYILPQRKRIEITVYAWFGEGGWMSSPGPNVELLGRRALQLLLLYVPPSEGEISGCHQNSSRLIRMVWCK